MAQLGNAVVEQPHIRIGRPEDAPDGVLPASEAHHRPAKFEKVCAGDTRSFSAGDGSLITGVVCSAFPGDIICCEDRSSSDFDRKLLQAMLDIADTSKCMTQVTPIKWLNELYGVVSGWSQVVEILNWIERIAMVVAPVLKIFDNPDDLVKHPEVGWSLQALEHIKTRDIDRWSANSYYCDLQLVTELVVANDNFFYCYTLLDTKQVVITTLHWPAVAQSRDRKLTHIAYTDLSGQLRTNFGPELCIVDALVVCFRYGRDYRFHYPSCPGDFHNQWSRWTRMSNIEGAPQITAIAASHGTNQIVWWYKVDNLTLHIISIDAADITNFRNTSNRGGSPAI
ncbi:hypothetical protein BBP40_004333 [Aspergillus hancockii]|nr:hypothetical protein BBP40_004333 [Aspergillus hancockii]